MAEIVSKFPNERFIDYLNTLHNASANNQSAIAELNITNPFFVKTMVQREVGHYIKNMLEGEASFIFVLTGHAGDGKTGILYQTLRDWNAVKFGEKLKKEDIVKSLTGRMVKYIKDFSELTAEERLTVLEKAKVECSQGITTFLVANTGPLIKTFDDCFSNAASAQLLDAIDNNDGQIKQYDGIPVAVINVATIDNSTFVKPFLHNLLSETLWDPCSTCGKKDYCAIYSNRCLMEQSSDRVNDFITKHYVFQQEYGEKLTIRQIVGHLSFTLTGGLKCEDVPNSKSAPFKFLFSNNFFGCKGIHINREALNMRAVADIVRAAYDQKRLRADESLFIKRDLTGIFTKYIAELLDREGELLHYNEDWQRAVRRAYMFLNIDTSETSRKEMLQDVFSYWFPRYLQLRSGEPASGADKELVQDALQMIFTESISGKEKDIPITMKRENGVSQSVQLVYDSIIKKKVKIELEKVSDYSQTKRFLIYISVAGERVNTRISLPMFDYFEEIRRGAIATNIDPMLSQGIDSLKAQIISLCEADRLDIELLTLTGSGWESINAEYDAGDWRIV